MLAVGEVNDLVALVPECNGVLPVIGMMCVLPVNNLKKLKLI